MSEPKQNRIKPSYLRAFVTVVDRGNFGEAALDLNVSQSAVSYAIAALEEELGVILLTRGRNGVTLTPAGEALIEAARQILRSLSGMVEVAATYRSLQAGRVRIGVFRSVGTYLLPPVLAEFQAHFPKITTHITDYADSAAVKQALKDYQIDIGFTDMENGEEFDTREILKDTYVVLLPPNPQKPQNTLSWQELAAYPFISEAPGNVWYTRLNQYLTQCGVKLKPAYEIREDSTRVGMVAQGLGATIIPRLAAEPIPPGVQICPLPVPLERSIGAAVLTSVPHPPAVFTLLEMLQQSSCTFSINPAFG
ncbi:MAG: LysR family transcriptional regulator [Oscillatoriophycideae cyanobacterium NC_groundwater_1537_Pr4_S-0.65um_50_18]|nr:LysR family transcriptional regulator [Oscillatoriophycideae cyanobacterium NC_groundwater_1537_Pr4_S-0.65um_50_18]